MRDSKKALYYKVHAYRGAHFLRCTLRITLETVKVARIISKEQLVTLHGLMRRIGRGDDQHKKK